MDRRSLIKGAAAAIAAALLPPLLTPANLRDIRVTLDGPKDDDWHHYAVTLCDGEYEAMIDGETVTRPAGKDYEILEELTDAIDKGRSGPVMTAEVWRKKDWSADYRVTQSGEFTDYLGRVIV